MGLELLHPKPGGTQSESLNVDIVAVHGLNGDATSTWKGENSETPWLQDLPTDIKSARVMTFGYNADVAFGNTTADVLDHAKDLLGSLLDEREADHEIQQPIVFIAHSLGGIIVKQALVWAHMEPRYQNIKDHTLGIVFFGTPHRGSGKATYGKTLANVATGVMHKPKSRLINALESNSDTLLRLTSEFKFQAPNVKIVTFYEMKPMKMFSGLIVEKHSALLEVSHEDQQPVNANHRDMCKFDSREDETYKKLVKRVNRMLKDETSGQQPKTTGKFSKSQNTYYEVPYNVSSNYTGREDISRQLEQCLPPVPAHTQKQQRRFVLYGLGGSGKTQVCLKFAQDHRENFWGIFFIHTSNASMVEQSFSTLAQTCGVGESMVDFKRWLSNSQEPWLLILDNADEPSLDVSNFFPMGNRGSVIVTTRNRDCRCHATVGSLELREMGNVEAITLLLRSADLANDDEHNRSLAQPIVHTLGCLALAVIHAGAAIRQGICSLPDYLEQYASHRKKLLSRRPAQASADYAYTVYTTWEISVDSIKELVEKENDGVAANALDLLTVFGFFHFDDITENMFRSAWEKFSRMKRFPWWMSNQLRLIRDHRPSSWHPGPFRDAIHLLSSYSLINISGPCSQISLHPLVHSWIRDSLNEEMQSRWWMTCLSTLALAGYPGVYLSQRQLVPHLRHCLGVGRLDGLFSEDENAFERVNILNKVITVYASTSQWKDALELAQRGYEYSRKMFGDESRSTFEMLDLLGYLLNCVKDYQKTVDFVQDKIDISIRVLGAADHVTIEIMRQLSRAYTELGRKQEALELAQRIFTMCEESLDEKDPSFIIAMEGLAQVNFSMDRHEEAAELCERAIKYRKASVGENDQWVLSAQYNLGMAYGNLGRYEDALDIFQIVLKKYQVVYGEEHLKTLRTMVNLGITFGEMDQPKNGIPLLVRAIDVGTRTGVGDNFLQEWREYLEYLQSQSAAISTTGAQGPAESQESPHREGKKPKEGRGWRKLLPHRQQIPGSSS